MPVFSIFDKSSEAHLFEAKPMNGNFDEVYPVGFDYHPVTNAARHPDGGFVHRRASYQGLPVDLTHLPTVVCLVGAPRPLPDIIMSRSKLLVSDRFKAVVDQVEPETHQFSPVEIIWENGSHAGDYFWFYPGSRIDGMDKQQTTHLLSEKSGHWRVVNGGLFVADPEQIAGRHIWVDPRLPTFAYPFVSERFRLAADSAGLSGVGFNEIPLKV